MPPKKLPSPLAAVVRCLRAPFALVMEPRQQGLSLGRCSLLAVTIAVVWLIYRHPETLIRLGWPASSFLGLVYLVLAAYNFGQKPAVMQVILALAGRLPNSGEAPNLSVPGINSPAEPTPDTMPAGPSAPDEE